MPLYEYKCEKCGRRMEKIRKFSDPPLTTCESCGGELEQLISSPAIRFKGTGWYITDYANKSAVPGNGSSGESSSSTEKKAENKEVKQETSSKPSEPARTSPS